MDQEVKDAVQTMKVAHKAWLEDKPDSTLHWRLRGVLKRKRLQSSK